MSPIESTLAMRRMSVLLVLLSAQASSQEALTAPQIAGVVARGTPLELIQEGLGFTEGPVGTPDGGLYFTAIRANRIYRMEPDGEIRVHLENSEGANGLVIEESGSLLAARDTGIIRVSRVGEVTPVVSEADEGVPFLRPNDLITDSRGGIYFTDPGPRPVIPGRRVHVYYLPPQDSRVVLLDDAVVRPNGVTLSSDGDTLFVNDSFGDTVFAYDIQPDGLIENKRPFAVLRDVPEDGESGADGMVIDQSDRLYVTTESGVQVFDNMGEYLGTIPVPYRPTNVAFSGSGKSTLYITTFEGVYRLATLTRGLSRPGK